MVRRITPLRLVLGLLRHGRIILGLVLRLEFEILMDDHDLVHMASVCVSVTVSNREA